MGDAHRFGYLAVAVSGEEAGGAGRRGVGPTYGFHQALASCCSHHRRAVADTKIPDCAS